MDGEARSRGIMDALTDAAAERDYLAHVLSDPTVLRDHPLAPEQMFSRVHRDVLVAMLALFERGEEIDLLTLRKHAGHEVADAALEIAERLPTSPAAAVRDRLEELAGHRSFTEAISRAHVAAYAGDIATAREHLVEAGQRGTADRAQPFPTVSTWSADPLGEPPPSRRWLLRRYLDDERSVGWLPFEVAGMLAAAGGVGKTVLALQLALSVAADRRWLGCFGAPEPGHVLMLLAEERHDEVRRRLHLASVALGLDTEERARAAAHLTILPRAGTSSALLEQDAAGNLRDAPTLVELRRRARAARHPWRLIVLDPLARLAPADAEKDPTIATRFVSAVESLIDLPGNPSVLVLHHTAKISRGTGKIDANDARGTTGLSDGFRWHAGLGRVKGDRRAVELRVVKSNYTGDREPVYLTRGGEDPTLRPMSLAELAAAGLLDEATKGANAWS